ncbi:MAG: hypothetical protein J5790_06170 [Bacteroidaceae bacterium]|nr:hypothetical protein [Bacteroidaceae bacterium]
MTCIMNRTIAMGIALAMTFGIIYAEKLPKPNKKQREQDIQRLIEWSKDTSRRSVLEILKNGELCFNYCMSAYNRPVEEYARDTAAIQEVYRLNDWTKEMCQTLTEKEVKKYHLEWHPALVQRAAEENISIYERFAVLTRFCDKVYEMRRKAATQTMPTGKVKHLIYEEYGSSRPTPVHYEIKIDEATGKVTLYGFKDRFMDESAPLPQVALGEEELNTIRQMIEKHKIYQELSSYTRPHIPNVPEITGGPPTWYFNCELEDGKVSTGGDQISPPRGCTEIANYLSKLLIK